MKKLILIMFLVAVLITGCREGGITPKEDITSTVRSLPEVGPDSDLKITLLDKLSVEESIGSIREECKSEMEIKPYWKVEIRKDSENLTLWLDHETNEVLCLIKKAVPQKTEQPVIENLTTSENKTGETGIIKKEEEIIPTASGECNLPDGLECVEFKINPNALELTIDNKLDHGIIMDVISIKKGNCAVNPDKVLYDDNRGTYVVRGCSFGSVGEELNSSMIISYTHLITFIQYSKEGDIKAVISGATIEDTTEDKVTNESKVLVLRRTFRPEEITIKEGTTVVWENIDTQSHMITLTNTFKSPLLEHSDKFEYQFITPGVYEYIDSIGKFKGKVIVSKKKS